MDYSRIYISGQFQPKIRMPDIICLLEEDDLKILKVEYVSNSLFDHTQILNLDFGNQNKPSFVNRSSEDNVQWKTTSKF